MRKWMFIMLILTCSGTSWGQVKIDTLDYKYLEDQLYLSISYNMLQNRPAEDVNSLFSFGIELGFIRDIPFNKRRNVGMGIGLGYAFNSYKNQVILSSEDLSNTDFVQPIKTEKFKTNLIEMPIEFRWRSSTPSKYNFWRIYGGFKLAYTFLSKTEFKYNEEHIKLKNLSLFNKFQYGAILSVGYGTWNVYSYYGLSQLFNGVNVKGEELNLKDFSIGLKFYIL